MFKRHSKNPRPPEKAGALFTFRRPDGRRTCFSENHLLFHPRKCLTGCRLCAIIRMKILLCSIRGEILSLRKKWENGRSSRGWQVVCGGSTSVPAPVRRDTDRQIRLTVYPPAKKRVSNDPRPAQAGLFFCPPALCGGSPPSFREDRRNSGAAGQKIPLFPFSFTCEYAHKKDPPSRGRRI